MEFLTEANLTNTSSVQQTTSGVALKCTSCGTEFPSRNKLFKHVRTCGSTVDNALVNTNLAPFDHSEWTIYAVGGRLRGRTLNSCEQFSFKNQAWTDFKHMLDHRGSHTAVSYDKSIYVFGGGGFESNLSSCEKYSLATGEWTAIAPMNSLRHAHSICRSDTNIFIIGGWIDGSRCIGDVEVYNISNDSWSSVTPLQTPRRLHASTAIHGKIFVFGGNSSNDNHKTANTMLHLDATGSNFATSATAAENIPGLSTVDTSGTDPSTGVEWYTKKAECYNIVTDTWSYVKDLPISGPCSAIALSVLLTPSGEEKDYVFIFMHGKFVLRYDVAADTYTKCNPLPERNWYCFDVCMLKPRIHSDTSSDNSSDTNCTSDQHHLHDGHIYAVGGAVDGAWANVLYAYNIYSDTWTKMPGMRLPRRRCCAVAIQQQQ